MKIVILALHLSTGGVENVICSIANILCNKHDVEIVSTYKIDEKPAFYLDKNVKVTYLINNLKPNKKEFKEAIKNREPLKICKEGIKSFKVLYLKKSRMIKAIKKLDCDIAISTRDIHNKWLGKYGNKNIIKIAQEHNYHNNDEKYINRILDSIEDIDYFMPTSKELADFYEKRIKNKKTKVKFIRNSLDRFPTEVSNLENKNLISVGRISSEKGFLDLVDVFKLVNKERADWKLNIVGDGDQYEAVKDKIREEQLEKNIIMHGFKKKDELEKIFFDSSIYVMTSFTESFGLVLLEAESYGLPLIAFDSAKGAFEILEDNANGFFIENRDKEKMAKKIIELIDNIELRKKLGQAGREKATNYKKEKVADEWYKFLENIK